MFARKRMLRARARQRKIFSHARDRARPQACTRWRRRSEHRRHGRSESGRQLEHGARRQFYQLDYAALKLPSRSVFQLSAGLTAPMPQLEHGARRQFYQLDYAALARWANEKWN